MNERIKDLWDQSARKNAKLFVGPNSWETEVNFMNTFAELIIKECTNVALEQKKLVEEMEVYFLQDEVWNRARIRQSERIVDKIKEHFGVE